MGSTTKGITMSARLEHVNITVSDPTATADLLCQLFDWRVRWSGRCLVGGRSIHVGADNDYLAIYTADQAPAPAGANKNVIANLNHVGVVVDDLDQIERRVVAAGLQPTNHGDYEPGRRFYFDDPDGIEFEVVSYS